MSDAAAPTTRRITEGGRDLRAYLTEIEMSVPDWCEKHGLDRIQVQRVLNGERWKRVTVEFANAIERATDGRIKYTQFLPSTATGTDSTPDLSADGTGPRKAQPDAANDDADAKHSNGTEG